MNKIPDQLIAKLLKVVRTSNKEFAQDKLEVFLVLYIQCETANDVYHKLNLRQVWRFMTHTPELINKEILGEAKYKAFKSMYQDALSKYS